MASTFNSSGAGRADFPRRFFDGAFLFFDTAILDSANAVDETLGVAAKRLGYTA